MEVVELRRLLTAGFLAAVVAVPPASAQGQFETEQEWDDKAVERAINRAKAYLWSQWSGGHWAEPGRRGKRNGSGYAPNYGGVTALCTYALLAAGDDPQQARMKRTLQWLAACPMHGTYARSLRANVWGMLGRDTPFRKHLLVDVKWLTDSVDGRGAYNYYPGPKVAGSPADPRPEEAVRYDNSNSQLAVLGVWAGVRNGVEVPLNYWQQVERHWISDQNPDGGWGYRRGRTSYGSMSVAGLASMFICFDNIYYMDFLGCKADTADPHIVKGMKWLDQNFSATRNPGYGGYYYYYLYGVERVGLASGYKYFGKKDWYKLGASALLRRQRPDGQWGGVVDTSFALLFLARGRHPVLFNKLEYPGSWNPRPRDLANLTRWMSRTFETQVNWQIIHLGVPVAEWHDAPILYISGAVAPRFSKQDLEKLRRFVHQGGVIFSEAACSQATFTLAMKRYYARLFPEYELKRLGRGHPLFSKDLHFPIRTGWGLSGISNGVRLLAIHAAAEVSRAWQLNNYATEGDAFRLAANIYFYVTDKGILPPRGVSRWPRKMNLASVESLRVARIRHAGNWNPEPLAWRRFAILMSNRYRQAVDVSEPMEIAKLDAAQWPAAAMTGTAWFEFTDEQKRALVKYVAAGGTLVVDAAGGSDAFAAAAESQIRNLLPGGEYVLIPGKHAIYDKAGPRIDKVRYRRATRTSVIDPRKPRLRGVSYKGRIAIVFSRDDLTAGLVGYPCWGLKGYKPDSAFALMRNILLYANGKTLSPAPPILPR